MRIQSKAILSLLVAFASTVPGHAQSCEDTSACGSGLFCDFEFDTAGGECQTCDDIYLAADCNLLPYESGQEDCKTTCLTACDDTESPCSGADEFCSYQSTMEEANAGYCVDCSGLLSPSFCTVGDFWVNTTAGETACLDTCFEPCSPTDGCEGESKSFCNYIHGSNSTGHCESCQATHDTDPDSCFLNFYDTPSQATSCASTCFDSCTIHAGNSSTIATIAAGNNTGSTCDDGFFCAVSNENPERTDAGYCMDCTGIVKVSDCFGRNATPAARLHCANTCLGTCSVDSPCPQGKHCDFKYGDYGFCIDCSNLVNSLYCTAFFTNEMAQKDCISSCFHPCDETTNTTCPLLDDFKRPLFCDHQLSATAGGCVPCPSEHFEDACDIHFDVPPLNQMTTPETVQNCRRNCLRPCDPNEDDCPADELCSASVCRPKPPTQLSNTADSGAYCYNSGLWVGAMSMAVGCFLFV